MTKYVIQGDIEENKVEKYKFFWAKPIDDSEKCVQVRVFIDCYIGEEDFVKNNVESILKNISANSNFIKEETLGDIAKRVLLINLANISHFIN